MNRPFLAVFLTATLFVTHFSFAERLDTEIEQILVSASLIPIDQKRSASAVTVINREQLQQRAALSVSDLLRDVPGVAVSRSGMMGSQTQVRVRGAEANQVLVLIDGIEANDPSLSDEANWGNISAVNVERIEIIRGPQSALYGSDAMAGVVNITTTRAEQPLNVQIYSERGSFATARSGITLGHAAGLYDVNFSASHLETEGANIAREGNEKDGYRNTTAHLSGSVKLGQQTRLSLTARHQETLSYYDEDSDYDGYVDDGVGVNAPGLFTDAVSQGFRATLEYQSPDDHWQHRFTISEAQFDNQNYKDYANAGVTASTKQRIHYVGSRFWDVNQQQLSLLVEVENEDFQQSGGFATGNDAATNVTRQTDSVALEYRIDPLPEITFGISTRHDSNDRFDDAQTYRLEALYRFDDSAQVRATWATAVKNPTFTELFGIYSGFVGNPLLQPEASTSWGLGVDRTFMSGNANVSLSVYKARLQDEIITVYRPDWSSTAANSDGESRRDGAELSATVRLASQLSVAAVYSYTDSVERSGSDNQTAEVRRPRHTASLSVAWQPRTDISINTNVQHNGQQYDNDWSRGGEYVMLKDYTLLNVHAVYEASQQLDIYLTLDNVLDENYEDVFSYQTLGFGGRLGARYKF